MAKVEKVRMESLKDLRPPVGKSYCESCGVPIGNTEHIGETSYKFTLYKEVKHRENCLIGSYEIDFTKNLTPEKRTKLCDLYLEED